MPVSIANRLQPGWREGCGRFAFFFYLESFLLQVLRADGGIRALPNPLMTQPESTEISVRHNPAANRFEAVVDGHLAVAEYQLEDGRVVFTHTFVPPELRGRGIAEKLVRPALKWARAEGKRVVPACSYVAAFVQRHAEFQSLVE